MPDGFATGATAPPGLLARPRRLDQVGRGHAGTGRAGPVLVPVLPGRTRPGAVRPRRQLGRPVAAARPRRRATRPGRGAAPPSRPPASPRSGRGRMARRVVRGPPRGRRGRARPRRPALPGRRRRRGRRFLGRRSTAARPGRPAARAWTPGCWCAPGWPPSPTSCASSSGTRPPACLSAPSSGTRRGPTRRPCCPPSSRSPATNPHGRAWLARVLAVTDPAAAAAKLRAAMDAAADPRRLPGRGGSRRTAARPVPEQPGGWPRPWTLAEQKAGYTRQAGLGPWTQLADEVRRLQVLTAMGQAGQVLDEVTRLRDRMATLPATPGPNEADTPGTSARRCSTPAATRPCCSAGMHDALALQRRGGRQPADRHAPADRHRPRPVQRLLPAAAPRPHRGGTGGAAGLPPGLPGRPRHPHARQDAQRPRRHRGQRAATATPPSGWNATRLRYSYLAENLDGIAISYHNLGNHLAGHARQPAPALASHLTSALICALIGNEDDGRIDRGRRLRPARIRPRRRAARRHSGPVPSDSATSRARTSPASSNSSLPTRKPPRRHSVSLIAQAQELAVAPEAEASPDQP